MAEKYRPKILVVDDEPDARIELSRMLTLRGYKVLEVDRGEAALEAAKTEWPSLIILDIVLPDIPGTVVFERLRADPLTKAIPILLLTAKPFVVENMPAAYGKAEGVVEKPGRVEDLLTKIQQLLSGQR